MAMSRKRKVEIVQKGLSQKGVRDDFHFQEQQVQYVWKSSQDKTGKIVSILTRKTFVYPN